MTKRLAPMGMNATRVKFRNLLFSDFKDKVMDMNSSVDQLTRCVVDVESALNSRYNKGDATARTTAADSETFASISRRTSGYSAICCSESWRERNSRE